MIKSASSVSANFRASCVSRSQAEWYSKICIVIEEADETRYWLELMKELYPNYMNPIFYHLNQVEELIKIFGKARGKVYKKYFLFTLSTKSFLVKY